MSDFEDGRAVVKVNRYNQRTAGIKILIGAKVIKKAKVIDADSQGFSIVFEAEEHEKDIMLMHARRAEVRVFTGIEVAINYCRRELGMRGGIEVLA
jgi:hypothetical protein